MAKRVEPILYESIDELRKKLNVLFNKNREVLVVINSDNFISKQFRTKQNSPIDAVDSIIDWCIETHQDDMCLIFPISKIQSYVALTSEGSDFKLFRLTKDDDTIYRDIINTMSDSNVIFIQSLENCGG